MDLNKLASLKREEMASTILLYGKERFLIEFGINLIKEKICGTIENPLNFYSLMAKETSHRKIIDISNTMQLFGDRQVVLVEDIDKAEWINSKEILSYIKSPAAHTSLIFTSSSFKKGKFYTLMKSSGCVIECKPMSYYQLTDWAKQYIQNKGFTIQREALNTLISCIGNNLFAMRNELDKIFNFMDSRKKISIRDIETLVPDVKIETVFTLTDAIGERDVKKSVTALHKLLNQGEVPQVILAMIIRQFRLLLNIKTLMNNSCTDNYMIKTAKIQPFMLGKLKSQTKRFSLRELTDFFFSMHNVDIQMKKTKKKECLLLESLIFDVCIH